MKLLWSWVIGAVAALAAERVQLDGHMGKLPISWSQGKAASPEALMTVYAMMRHAPEDVQKLEKLLHAVSDPRSPTYGQHLSLAETRDVTPIPQAQLELVQNFFASANKLTMTPNQDILSVELTVSEVERLFETKVYSYLHANGPTVLRATGYSLPAAVAEAVYTIGDLTRLPRIPERPQAMAGAGGNWPNACPDLAKCKGLITPAVLTQRYNIDNTGMDAVNNSMAVAEFQGQYFKQTDLDMFSAGCKVDVKVDTVVGGDVQIGGIEAELDIEYIRGVSPGIPLTVYYSGTYSLIDWMTKINGQEGAPWVHSVSYGNDEDQQTSKDYMFACNVQFMKAGVRGISVLFASGDQGVCGREGCGQTIGHKHYHPDFPASSPYITAVGGTDFVTADIGDELAWSAGGGGFSDTFDIPAWQKDLVAAYKASPDAKLPDQSKWNNTGRGYPDISALGGQKAPYCVVSKGSTLGVAGTSASCPVAASVFARLNGLRLKAGKPVMGFLNPWIYQNADVFNDVTQGINDAGGNAGGFTAIKGWDAATGVGTPNFGKMATRI